MSNACEDASAPSATGDEPEKTPLPPGSLGLPIIGETIQFLVQGTAFYADKLKKYGSIYKTHVLGSPTIRVSGAENVSTLVDREPEQLTMKWPTVVNNLMGAKSLATVVGPDHQPLRKHMNKAFTPFRLANYFPCVQRNICDNLEKWAEEGQQRRKVVGLPACEMLVADFMLELVLGCSKADDKDGKVRKAFFDASHNLFAIPIKIPGFGYWKAMRARGVILDFVKTQMSAKEDEKKDATMMDILMSLHGDGEMDEDKVKDNAIGLFLAGSSSTSGALNCVLFMLGKHPDVLAKVQEELREAGLFGKDAAVKLDYAVLQKLQYVHCVEKELLRCLPPVGGCFRDVQNDMELDGYEIPKDWSLIFSIRDTQDASAKLLKDGDEFRPSRWLEQDRGDGEVTLTKLIKSSRCHYMPFGAGPRYCVGAELARMAIKTFIVEVARSYRWDLLNPESPIVYFPITKPKDDMPMMFYRLAKGQQQ